MKAHLFQNIFLNGSEVRSALSYGRFLHKKSLFRIKRAAIEDGSVLGIRMAEAQGLSTTRESVSRAKRLVRAL